MIGWDSHYEQTVNDREKKTERNRDDDTEHQTQQNRLYLAWIVSLALPINTYIMGYKSTKIFPKNVQCKLEESGMAGPVEEAIQISIIVLHILVMCTIGTVKWNYNQLVRCWHVCRSLFKTFTKCKPNGIDDVILYIYKMNSCQIHCQANKQLHRRHKLSSTIFIIT